MCRKKDEAKAAGARWDPAARRWYIPHPSRVARLTRWAARPDVPALLPGEDRGFGSGLFVDLVPQSCWFTNVRTCIEPGDWERLRRMILGRAEHRCEACRQGEDRDVGRRLEAHERWAYDPAAGVQVLRRLICLCSDCHTATHFGLAGIKGLADSALAHLATVTGMTTAAARAHVDDAFALWRARSARTWTLDLAALTAAGITLAPPTATARSATARQELRRHRG